MLKGVISVSRLIGLNVETKSVDNDYHFPKTNSSKQSFTGTRQIASNYNVDMNKKRDCNILRILTTSFNTIIFFGF